MTKLSVNVNKIALLRNSRGRDFPNVLSFASRCLDLGAHGITLHPRPDQRHARYADVRELAMLCEDRDRELNVEGFPSEEFLEAVVRAKPDQCTLVPDAATQLTSDHGWDIRANSATLRAAIAVLCGAGIRVSLFVDFDCKDFALARELGAQRIELYTEPYAASYEGAGSEDMLAGFRSAAHSARSAGLGVNAGHDLSLHNLGRLLTIPGIDEVSIGHALIAECIEHGMDKVIKDYLKIIAIHAATYAGQRAHMADKRTTGVNHITFAVADVTRAVDFYVGVIGCEKVAVWKRGAYLQAGSMWICLSLDAAAASRTARDYTHVAFSFDSKGLTMLRERLAQADAIEWKVNASEGDSVYFLDPDHHRLEAHVGDLRTRLESLARQPYDGLEIFT